MTKASVFAKKNYQNEETDKIIARSGSKFVGKVFLYMFIALAITALTTMAFAGILTSIFQEGTQEQFDALSYVVIGMAVLYLPLIIWIQISVLRGGKGLTPAFVIYSIFMGALLSPVIAIFQALDMAGFQDVSGFSLMGAVGIAFGLTCAIFALMALIAWTTKKNLSGLAVVGFGFLMGAGLIALASLLIGLIAGKESALLSAIVSSCFFIFVLLITMVDLFNIRRIAARGYGTNNLAMVCAFSLYTDFVYVFIRMLFLIIRLLAIFGRRN